MQKYTILYIFLGVSLLSTPLFGQTTEQKTPISEHFYPWQEQLIQLVDIEDLGEDAYNELLEELSELELWSDSLKTYRYRAKQQLILSSNRCLNMREGYRNPSFERLQANKAYLGDPWRQSIRYRLHQGEQWQAGISLEKDPGEAWKHTFPYFDAWHAYLRYQGSARQTDIGHAPKFRVEDAIIGHYRLRIGYGLTMNQGFSLGKQYFIQQVSQRTNRIIPFASNAETDYLQGTALDLRFGRYLTVLPYFSIVQIDGSLTETHHLTTLYTDGMHRTITEGNHRHAVWQMVMGTRIGWKRSWYELGAHVLNTQFEYPYIRKLMSHNKNYFRGQSLTQFSSDYQFRAFHNVLKGELAFDDSLGLASLTALQTNWSDNWQSALIYHYYSNHYRQLHASGIGENNEIQGEHGLTVNVNGILSRHWQLQAMADWFSFDQPQYQTSSIPNDGFEVLVRGIYTRSWFDINASYRMKSKNESFRHSIDAVFNISPLSNLSLKTQLRKRINDASDVSHGLAVAQSLSYQNSITKNLALKIDTQATYFDTDDYNARIYINEKNILYGFGIPMLYGKGIRYSLTSNVKINDNWNVEIKYTLTNYANKATISSGLQEIKGNNQQDLWLQLQLAF